MNARVKHKERGAVLLTTLLVMSLMAAVAVAMIDDIRFGVKRASSIQAYAQAQWYMKGAEDFARSYLEIQIKSATPAQLNALMLKDEPIIFPIEGGAISLRVRDGSQCLNLGTLGASSGRREFRQLLVALGWPGNEAARMTSVVADWTDEDNQTLPGGAEDFVYMGRTPAYRTSNAPFTSVMELRALEGMSEEKFQALRPFVCVRNPSSQSQININTLKLAQSPILAAMLGSDDSLSIAEQILSERPAGGYENLSQLIASAVMQDKKFNDAALDNIVYGPKYIYIEANIDYYEAHRFGVYEYSITNGNIELVFTRQGRENFRPLPPEPKL